MKKAPLPKSRAKTAYGVLGEVARVIDAEPRRYNQADLLTRYRASDIDLDDSLPACGTVGCVAGWVLTLKKPGSRANAVDATQKILGLSDLQIDELVNPYAAGFSNRTRDHARRGVAHIRRFQKKYAAQLKAKKV